ncbi:hypothetical protein P8452_03469 [Trifolium repens]|nr:hypothetical protein P8452_03469 [Trifolium repens]
MAAIAADGFSGNAIHEKIASKPNKVHMINIRVGSIVWGIQLFSSLSEAPKASCKYNFKAKSDESEQDEAALATTPNMNGLQLSICGSLFNSIDAILKLDEDRIITGSENGMINMVGILLNRIIQPIAEHSEYPVECLAVGLG